MDTNGTSAREFKAKKRACLKHEMAKWRNTTTFIHTIQVEKKASKENKNNTNFIIIII